LRCAAEQSVESDMAENVPVPRKTSKARAAVNSDYRKGEETRQRVLEVALTLSDAIRARKNPAVPRSDRSNRRVSSNR
jgi:hypothetical protein